ncbi:L,D-transpeptidase [Ramlibacter montanisoli]|uniref:L,D-transpeptidase n=1 Tax=Ramlibacter montanisoli TaxID=2732512 RepID=A0A849K2B1_9BURK|nr:L,D-transpeptidase [Ramlibacter montanisoli]NNU42632.1 L,D-transpeptidase [Ramlibacter montanisoli]
MRNALLLGAALLMVPTFASAQEEEASDAAADAPAMVKTAEAPKKASKPATKASTKPKAKAEASAAKARPAGKSAAAKGHDKKTSAKKKASPEDLKPGPLANFNGVDAPADVVHVANWVSYTRNAKKKAFVLIDKKQARMYVFDPQGKLKSQTPILLGKAVGDHTVPGIGNKPFAQIKEDEKTTPAGRFLAQPGRNTKGEDIIWIDYNAAVSMHRLRKVKEEEKRADRMATPEADDNRISYGCVNVPAPFYNSVLRPTVSKQGAFVYVLPETKTPQQQFGSFDVPPEKVALK